MTCEWIMIEYPGSLLHSELAQGKCPVSRPQLYEKDNCKRDLMILSINSNMWEAVAFKQSPSGQAVQKDFSNFKETFAQQ